MADDNVQTVDDLIKALGGTGTVAAFCGVKPSAVSNWKQRGFPPSQHYRISKEAERRGLSVDESLFGLSKGHGEHPKNPSPTVN